MNDLIRQGLEEVRFQNELLDSTNELDYIVCGVGNFAKFRVIINSIFLAMPM
jgi:hypothetical protein